jgi:hypothetical protein
MPATGIGSKWVSGNLVFYDKSSGNTVATFDATNELLDIEASKLGIGGTAMTATAAEINAVADVSANGAVVKVKKIALTAATHGTGSEVDTGWDLPAKAVVLDLLVDVITAEATGATKTVDVGLLSSESGGDADGFLDGVSVAATGLVQAGGTFTTDHWVSTTRGALLLEKFLAGTNSTNEGVNVRKSHLSTAVTAKSVSITSGSAFTEFAGALYLVYVEIG